MEADSLSLHYEFFADLLLEDRIYLDPEVSFTRICRWMGADARQLDDYIRSELGLSGEALIRRYRQGEPARLQAKYARRAAAERA